MLAGAPRERAVLIYPHERVWIRRVFYNAHQKELQRELKKRFDVDVHEQVGTADEFFNVNIRGANLLVLSGHGCPYAISLQGRHDRTLDASQFARLQAFLGQLAPDATIILQSCDTGLGFAWIVKRAAGPNRRVIAAKGDIPRDGLQITSLLPLDVTITCKGGWDCTLRL